MSAVTLPKANVDLGHGTVQFPGGQTATVHVTINEEWMRAFTQLLERVGGTTSQTITELNIQSFEDAGIAEQQAQLYTLEDTQGQIPPSQFIIQDNEFVPAAFHTTAEKNFSENGIAELRERLTALETTIAGLMQGTVP